MAVGKIVTWKKEGKGKQYYIQYNKEADGTNIKWEKWKGNRYFGEENQDLK